MSREDDKKIISDIPREKIPDFIFMHLRNMWSIDGLYFLGIEEKYGTKVATEIDKDVWKIMGKIEARRLKNLFDIKDNNLSSLVKCLKLSGWALDLEDKEIIKKDNRVIISNSVCRIQNTRIQKNLSEFPCKKVRWGFLKSFAKEINPNIEVVCKSCPPDKHDDNIWCEWEFILR
ncbi:MAG: DUF6125 family protein [Candidatus Thermoplasmatota archaeon]|nr:DUF6125 family protein [Candidatus Thermoplasmatota archaeon]MCK5300251.1 hypothetical protein [Thermoplasmatales archaeon]